MVSEELSNSELLDRCLDKLSYYQNRYIALELEMLRVIRLVIFDKGAGSLDSKTQEEISNLHKKHITALL